MSGPQRARTTGKPFIARGSGSVSAYTAAGLLTNRPAAAAGNAGGLYLATDDTTDGPSGTLWNSNGSSWSMVPKTTHGLMGWFNVVAYGAVGNGTTDDQPAIQATINAASSSGGGVAYCPAATYAINSQVQVKSRVRLCGPSRGTASLLAKATFPTSTALVRLGDGTGLVTSCRIEFMKIDANNIAGSQCVYSTEANEISGIFNCVSVNFLDIGAFFSTSGCQNCGIENSEFYGGANFNKAVSMDGAGFMYVRRVTTHSNVAGTGTYGIYLQNTTTLVYDCHGEDTTYGVYFDTGASGSVSGYMGRATTTNAIYIASGNGGGITCISVTQNGSTNTINNQSRGEIITDNFVSHYVFANIGGGGGVLKNLFHSQNSPPWRIGALISAIQGIRMGDSGAPTITTGVGSPASVVTAPAGSIYLSSSGGATTTLWVKESGAGNTGWVAK